MTNNNDILCRWRDAITDPPRKRWIGLCNSFYGVFLAWTLPLDGKWTWETSRGAHDETWIPQPGDQWLDITAIPGVAREAVQAAVDEMERLLETAKRSCRQNYISSFERALDVITEHTGVTPSEVL